MQAHHSSNIINAEFDLYVLMTDPGIILIDPGLSAVTSDDLNEAQAPDSALGPDFGAPMAELIILYPTQSSKGRE